MALCEHDVHETCVNGLIKRPVNLCYGLQAAFNASFVFQLIVRPQDGSARFYPNVAARLGRQKRPVYR